jgi:hypothetical protein
MQRFFKDFESIDRFTLSLNCFDETVQCPHCSKRHQLVSHGVIYRQRSIDEREPVGKRVFCSNRNPHSGCGRTVQLYVAQVIPSFQYGAAQVLIFLSSLLIKFTLEDAYHAATGQVDPRNAWRWLQRLMPQLTHFRCFLKDRLKRSNACFQGSNRRLTLLLPTLKALFSGLVHCPCTHYQLQSQRAFF